MCILYGIYININLYILSSSSFSIAIMYTVVLQLYAGRPLFSDTFEANDVFF